MPKITNEAIFNSIESISNALQTLTKKVDGIADRQDGLEKKFIDMENKFIGMEKKQEDLLAKVIKLEHWAMEKNEIIEKISKDVSFIIGIVEKDAKKLKDHEAEHSANVSAHDRLDARIKVLEKAK